MKKTKAVKKVRGAKRREKISLRAVAEDYPEPRPKGRYVLLRDVLKDFKPLKKSVTLRLDADIVAFFKKPGPGYQTRINRALRNVVKQEKKALEE